MKTKTSHTQLCLEVDKKTNSVRNIQNLVNTATFKHVWDNSDAIHQSKAREAIKACDKKALNSWMMMHSSIELGEKPWKALIEHAKWYQIPNYSRLSRVELITALKEVERKGTSEHSKRAGEDEEQPEEDGGRTDDPKE